MQTCTKCNVAKTLDEFAWKSKATGVRARQCKQCHREYSKVHYDTNLSYYLDKGRINGKRNRDANKALVVEFLKTNPCVDCGESDLDVLEFDHIEMVGSKALRVSHFANYSSTRLLQEMKKCEVRCANCHSRRTRRMLGTSRYL